MEQKREPAPAAWSHSNPAQAAASPVPERDDGTAAPSRRRSSGGSSGGSSQRSAEPSRRSSRSSRSKAAANDAPLFRQEALDARRAARYGHIVLLPGASSRTVAWLSLALVVALGLLITLGSYTRRSTVAGQLLPSEGLIRVSAGQPGVVAERHAADGQQVKRGQVLFVLSGDRQGPDALDYQRGIAGQIEQRRFSLESELRRLALAEAQELEQLRRRADSMRGEAAQVALQDQLLSARVKGADDARTRYAELLRQGFASRDEFLARESEAHDARGRLEGHRRGALALERELGSTRREMDTVQGRYATQRADLERAILLARQEHTELEVRRRIVVAAPTDGRLTLVQAEVGQSVDPARPLAQLEPAASKLVARLYAPSRAAGFVQPGATVLLRYDAFPYQKYGQHAGRVAGISNAAVAPTELQGLVVRPELQGETLFAVSVELPAQALSADGQAWPLRAGMRVEADLLHENRRLYEWILEPLYAARARVDPKASAP